MRFAFKRLAVFLVALLVQSAVIFAALRVLPGDAAMVIGGTSSTPEQVARIRADMGLDLPYPRQYVNWLGDVLRGNLGESQLTGVSVGAQIGQRLQVTVPLALFALLIALAVGIPLGFVAATARSAFWRRFLQLLAIVAGAVPALWGGLLLISIFGRGIGALGFLPVQGFPSDGWGSPGRAFTCLVLPAVSVGIICAAQMMRYTRSALVSIYDSDCIAHAMACGMTRRQALRRVGLRLAAPQLVSVAGLMLASLVTGVLVVENLFALPGLATLLMNDIHNRDLLAVQSELLVLSAFFLLMGLIVDALNHALDPRLASGAEGEA